MQDVAKVACVQAESVAFDRAATIEKVDALATEIADNGARLALAALAYTLALEPMRQRARV